MYHSQALRTSKSLKVQGQALHWLFSQVYPSGHLAHLPWYKKKGCGQTHSVPFQMNGFWQMHWLVGTSQYLGAGHSTHDGPYLPAGQIHWFPFQTFVGGGHSQVFVPKFQTLGAGHGIQLSPKVFGGHEQVLAASFHWLLGCGQEHTPWEMILGNSQHEHSWVTLSQVCPGSQVTHFWLTASHLFGAVHLTQ